MKKSIIPNGSKIEVKLTTRDHYLLCNETFCDSSHVSVGVAEGDEIRFDLTLDVIEEIQGYVAAEANHAENKKLQRELEKLFNKLQIYLDTYEEDVDGGRKNISASKIPTSASFTNAAKKKWDDIGETNQNLILNNVFCVDCPGPVFIILETANIERGNLILRGKCSKCGHKVCRVVGKIN